MKAGLLPDVKIPQTNIKNTDEDEHVRAIDYSALENCVTAAENNTKEYDQLLTILYVLGNKNLSEQQLSCVQEFLQIPIDATRNLPTSQIIDAYSRCEKKQLAFNLVILINQNANIDSLAQSRLHSIENELRAFRITQIFQK